MSLPILLRPNAQVEFEEAMAYYESQSIGLGRELELAIQETLDEIAATPQRFPIVLSDVREAIVARFPYCVYYRVRNDRIVILSIFHHSRDPNDWKRRV